MFIAVRAQSQIYGAKEGGVIDRPTINVEKDVGYVDQQTLNCELRRP